MHMLPNLGTSHYKSTTLPLTYHARKHQLTYPVHIHKEKNFEVFISKIKAPLDVRVIQVYFLYILYFPSAFH